MKDRIIKNWITSVIGILIALFGLTALWFDKVSVWGLLPILLLSWAFITGKNTLLSGMTANILKFK